MRVVLLTPFGGCSPAGWRGEWSEPTEAVDVWNDQIRTEACEHGGTIVPLTELPGGDVEQGPYVPTEALRRAHWQPAVREARLG